MVTRLHTTLAVITILSREVYRKDLTMKGYETYTQATLSRLYLECHIPVFYVALHVFLKFKAKTEILSSPP